MRDPLELPAFLLLAATLVTSGSGAAQPPAPPAAGGTPPAASFGETAEVRVVEIPVQVTRDGEPVRGLTASDFAVVAGKQPQTVIGFDVVDVQTLRAAPGEAPAKSVASLPAAGRRHFLFLFDLSYSDPQSLVRAQKGALEIARNGLQLGDLAAVSVYSPTKGARLLLGFTSDRAQVELALATLGSTELIERRPDYGGLLLGQARDNMAVKSINADKRVLARLGGADGEGAEINPAADIAKILLDAELLAESMRERDFDSAERDRAQRFTTSLAQLGDLMAQVQGRKHVIFLSRGFDSSLLVGQHEPQGRAIESADEELREITRVDSDNRWGNARLQRALRESLEHMKWADCAIHSIDISGAETQGRAIAGELRDVAASSPTVVGRGNDALFVMAKETGGTFHRNYNDLAAAMNQVLEATGVTYLLTIQPTGVSAPKDGYVPLRVTVPGARGATVSHRLGYFARPPAAVESAVAERMQIASRLVEGRAGGELRARLLALPAPWGGSGGQALITVDGPSLLAAHEGDALSAEITLYAFDAAGAIRDHARQLVGLDLRAVGERLKRHGLRLLAGLDLPPGEYDVRALVRNTVTGRWSITTAHLAVPAASASAIAASFVEPAPGDWLLARESTEGGGKPPDYPFTIGDRILAPSLPRLHAGEGAMVWVETRAVADAGALAATVTRIDGSVVGQAALELQQRQAGEGGERLLAALTPPALPPGSYLLELRLASGGGPAAAALAFSVE
jgi:VWFA-related protein